MIKPNFEPKQNKAQAAKYVQQLTIEGIPIELIYKKVAKGRLSVDQKGDVKLIVPYQVELKRLEEFLYSKIDWLKGHLKKVQLSKPMERMFVNGEFVYLFGAKHDCFIFEHKNNSVTKEDGIVHMRFKAGISREKKLKLLRDWYSNALHEVIAPRLAFWEEKTGLKCSEWRIRLMKSCWGSCNPDTKKLLFNLRLIKKPLNCIDYIIVHELGHMVSRFHGKIFKDFLSLHLPSWRQVRRELNLSPSDFTD